MSEARARDAAGRPAEWTIDEHGALTETRLAELRLVSRGKVRDMYDLGEHLLIVTTDRISAFDWVLPNGIPDKGKVLNQLSAFWFGVLGDVVPTHLVSTDVATDPRVPARYRAGLGGRSMIVRRAEVFPVECVARGYLIGSGWKDYQKTGAVCGIPLPQGLPLAARLPEVIFTPATKAQSGHDENIDFATMSRLVGAETAAELRRLTIELYRRGAALAEGRGIIIADTKFEFGRHADRIHLVDEALTPDSSRFWPADAYAPGQSPPSFDKQFVRDWLETTSWDKNSPPPRLSATIVAQTRKKYLEALVRLTGHGLR
ncbi:MAG: phosphoribosylaminoimidazolesuccinocarboxamide synthase [Candidatus Rokubacteria bacterium]|nr:phosphoribosylaminoimidazolesuccinocarboxamide synthase [Candidatus Rokubacteria bacterium]